jgi:large exoprotein involved in heme utilization and adhesion
LNLDSGGTINSGTTNTGAGGNITINATNSISISGAITDGTPSGIYSRTVGQASDAGAGGNIALTSGQSATISNGASISASSTGPGNTGNIQINAGQSFVATNSSVTTQANLAKGGIIKITTDPSGTVQLTNSTISASVLDGTGGGGSVNIDPQFVILQNSQILAQAVQGPGGNISITTNLLLPDANSVVSASSQFGVNGTVTVQSPNAPASGHIQPLGKTPLQATSLLNQRCASLAGGEFSSFTVAGRDSLPTEPGSWLASPLALSPAGFSAGTVTEGGEQARVIDPAQETTGLSLRQIAPAGFLTQAFAVDWSASCQS